MPPIDVPEVWLRVAGFLKTLHPLSEASRWFYDLLHAVSAWCWGCHGFQRVRVRTDAALRRLLPHLQRATPDVHIQACK